MEAIPRPVDQSNGPARTVTQTPRARLPDTRPAVVHKFKVAECEGFISVGFFEDGKPGELFITMSHQGSTIGGLMDCLAAAVSIALQHGTDLESLVKKLAWQRFEPSGYTSDPNIPYAYSIPDYIFRWLGRTFCPQLNKEIAAKEPKPLP